MKTNEQQDLAQHLYFQTDLNKTQIAATLGISRRSLHYWIKENNWDRIKRNAEYMPSLLTENMFIILGNLMDDILCEERHGIPVTTKEINDIYKLTLTINKLRARSANNESMQVLTHLLNDVNNQDPALADQLQPYVTRFIESSAAKSKSQYLSARFNASGHTTTPKDADKEHLLDLQDRMFFDEQEAKERREQTEVNNKSTTPVAETPSTPIPPSKPSIVDRPNSAKALKELFRGTASKGPGKAFRKNHNKAA